MIEILAKIRQAGGTVAVVSGDIRLRVPKGLLSDQERSLLAEHKAEIVKLLADDRDLDQDDGSDRWETAVDPPPACQQCGSLELWWDFWGGQHCQRCEAAGFKRSQQLLERAARLRRTRV